MANRKGTVKNRKADMGSYNVSTGNFWDIDNYHKSVKRIGESSALCDDLVKMFSERVDIESKYGKRLDEWHDKWSKTLETSCMYATMKTAALGTLKEAQDRAKIHMDCCMKLQNQVIETIKRWKESNYHHKILGIKEMKEFEQDFAKAQKPWAVAFQKVQRAKSNYHNACRQRDLCATNLNNAKTDSEFPPEKLKKLEDSLRKSENSVSTMQQKYDEKLKRISPLNVSYESDMLSVYDRWQKGEEKRKDFLQRTLQEFHKCVNIHADVRLKQLFDNQLNVTYSGKTDYDVKWWAENYGADMARNWPKFEGYSPLEWHQLNLRYLASSQKKQLRRYTTRPRPYEGRFSREPGDLPDEPHVITAVEPSGTQDYRANSVSNGVKPQQQQQQYSYQSVSEPPNPFENGDEADNMDDDEWETPPPAVVPGGGVPVRALYDYSKVEDDELSFNAGDILTKLTEEDEQGWCRGRFNGEEGLYPANYVEQI